MINDIAEKLLNEIQDRAKLHLDIAPLLVQHSSLPPSPPRVDHEQLDAIVELCRHIQEKLDHLESLPKLLYYETSLDALIQLKINKKLIREGPKQPTERDMSHPSVSSFTLGGSPRVSLKHGSEPIDDRPGVKYPTSDSNYVDPGQTDRIHRAEPVVIPCHDDTVAGTLACRDNQLLYNDYEPTTSKNRLTFIADLRQMSTRRYIDWTRPTASIAVRDDDRIQDIAYSEHLRGYLLLNQARLRLLRDGADELEEFQQFSGRCMKRVTSDERFIYLISSAVHPRPSDDGITLMNYAGEENVRKSFRYITSDRYHRSNARDVGELTDLAVSSRGKLIVPFRFEKHREVGISIFSVSEDGRHWSRVQSLLIDIVWQENLMRAPRVDWCRRLNQFVLIEYQSGHLTLLDEKGNVNGECYLAYKHDRWEMPVNLTCTNDGRLCVRFASSINLYSIGD